MHNTDCAECRAAYEEDDRDPPCEEKGRCPISAVELLPENRQPVELYRLMKPFGADIVFKLLDLRLTPTAAEDLLDKLALIDATVGAHRSRQQPQS